MYLEFLLSNLTSLQREFSKTHAGFQVDNWSLTYGSTPRISRASSPPLPFRASPSNVIDVDEDNHDGDRDGD